ncbi:MAG: hypothetical protein JW993_20610 [Sedimentisphaerales bacterium]|nr:hypothetical protein [Sedimentisphaerales bacterium]
MGGMRKMAAMVLLVIGTSVAAGQESQIVYLSGRGNDDPVRWDFFCTAGQNSEQWTTIDVPSNWELKGFGSYNYGHDRRKSDEQGKYKRSFSVPDAWQAQRIFLVFEGVMTDTEVWVNGRSAGPKHQGGFYRFKYEITDLVQPGENLLQVTVSKVSSDRSVEQAERQADYWVFGGIYRPVYLEVVPKELIEWVAVDARADGTFHMDVHLNGSATADAVRCEIVGPGGGQLGQPAETTIGQGANIATIRTQVSGHERWTAETPNLYSAKVTLLKGSEVLHTITQRFGFRTFEVRPRDGLYLNGQKIRLKGVCRHSFWPDSGRCLSRKINYDDVRLIKEMNMNAVRMSHYPPDQDFLDACDELGLYVLDELAGWQKPPYDTEIGKKLVAEMVPRDVCHPCILFWDNANEGGWNRDLDGEFALYDLQQRTVLHPWELFGGIDTDHYESYASTLNKLASGNLHMPTEFLHGLYDGGHGAGLNDYWTAMTASPMGAGGFLWALVDEGVVRTDEGGRIDVRGNLAPDGIVGPYRQKEASFYTIKEIWSPIRIPLERLPSGFDGKLPVENHYDFTNLSACRFTLELVNFPDPEQERGGHEIVAERTVGATDVPPHGKGTLSLPLPAYWRDAEALHLTARGPGGEEIWTWSWDLQSLAHYRNACVETESEAGTQPRVDPQEDGMQVHAGDLTLGFATTGRLAYVSVGDRRMAFEGPELPVGTMQPARVTVSEMGDAVVLDGEYKGNLRRACWTVYPTGWVRLDYELALEGQFDLFGISFDYPEEKMRSMRWLGRGPYRVWKNRMQGGKLDAWTNAYKDHVPGQTWDFPEFEGYYRDWHWVTFETEEGDITIVNDTDNLFLGVYTPNDGPAPANTKLDAPPTGIALLHGIPPIGTKFQKPGALGPEGQQNTASGAYRGSVWFKFDVTP